MSHPALSKVPGFEGLCKPTWLNRNQITRRLTGETTGFFRLVKKRFGIWWKVGEEFHGKLDSEPAPSAQIGESITLHRIIVVPTRLTLQRVPHPYVPDRA